MAENHQKAEWTIKVESLFEAGANNNECLAEVRDLFPDKTQEHISSLIRKKRSAWNKRKLKVQQPQVL